MAEPNDVQYHNYYRKNEYIDKVETKFYQIYEQERWEISAGYTSEQGIEVVIFYNKFNNRNVHVYLDEVKNILKPYKGQS